MKRLFCALKFRVSTLLRRNKFDFTKLQFSKQLYKFITLEYYLSYNTVKPTKLDAILTLFSVIA